MANLLPQQLKKISRKEYVLRSICIGLCACSAIVLVGVASLLPSYILLGAKLSAVGRDDDTKNALSKTSSSSAETIEAVRAYVTLLKQDTYSREIPYGIFAEILKKKGDTIEFSRLSFSRSDNTLHVAGKATTRVELKNFFDRIGQDDIFMPIPKQNFPYADLSGSKDNPFKFDIALKEGIQP